MTIGHLLKVRQSLGNLLKLRTLSTVPSVTDTEETVNKDGVRWKTVPKNFIKASTDGFVGCPTFSGPEYVETDDETWDMSEYISNPHIGSAYVIRDDEPAWVMSEYIRNPHTYNVTRAEGSGIISSLDKIIELIDLKKKFKIGDNWKVGLEDKKIVELLALKNKLQMDVDWEGVIVESGCKSVVGMVNNYNSMECKYLKMIQIIDARMQSVREKVGKCDLEFTHNEANGVAHHLSQLELDKNKIFYDVSEIEDENTRVTIIDNLKKDKSGYRYPWEEK